MGVGLANGKKPSNSLWSLEVLGLLAIVGLGAYKFVEKTWITITSTRIAVAWAIALVLFLAGWILLHRRRPFD